MLKLVIRSDDGSERSVDVRAGLVRIGRAPDNDIVLADASKGVSRTHAELRFENGRWFVLDLNSQNGTWLNGHRVQRADLPAQGEITVGLYRIILQTAAAAPSPAAPGAAPRPTAAAVVPPGRSASKPRHAPQPPMAPTMPVPVIAGPPPGELPRRSRSNAPWFAIAAIVVIAGGALAWLLSPRSAARQPASDPAASAPAAGSAPADPDNRLGKARAGGAAAADALDAGNRLDAAGDWIGALEEFDRVHEINPATPGLDEAVTRVHDKMRVAGNDALERARQYDTLGRPADALKEYDKAAQWLPAKDPNREIARMRAQQLKAGAK